MKHGIMISHKHSFYDYGINMVERKIGQPQKDDHTERVPYSNITYDFDLINGKSSYGERTISYKFEFIEFRRGYATEKLINIKSWVHWLGRMRLHDDMIPSYSFSVREPQIDISENHNIYTIDLIFMAEPDMLKDPILYIHGDTTLPDINNDGVADAVDASAILSAYTSFVQTGKYGFTGVYKLQTSEPDDWATNFKNYYILSDNAYSKISTETVPAWAENTYYTQTLTAEQQIQRADANMNGTIDAIDASLVLQFYSKFQMHEYEDMTQNEAWASFINEYLSQQQG